MCCETGQQPTKHARGDIDNIAVMEANRGKPPMFKHVQSQNNICIIMYLYI